MKIFVALVVGKPGIVRDGLQAVVAAIPGIDALKPVNTGPSAITQLNNHSQAIVILDSSLREKELLGIWSEVRSHFPQIKCLAIADSPCQQQTFEAAGMQKVFIEGVSPSLLSRAIKSLMAQPSIDYNSQASARASTHIKKGVK